MNYNSKIKLFCAISFLLAFLVSCELREEKNITPPRNKQDHKTIQTRPIFDIIDQKATENTIITTEQGEQKEVKELENNQKLKVALLAPLSGDFDSLGKSMVDAATLSLFDNGDKNLSLIPIDSKSSEFDAMSAVQKAIGQDANIILGPVFSGATNVIIPYVKNKNVSVISFSNDISLAGKGVYLMSNDPREEIRKMLEYAIDAEGIKFFGIIAPANNYGSIINKDVAAITESKGAMVVKSEFTGRHINLEETLDRLIFGTTKNIYNKNRTLVAGPNTKRGLIIVDGANSVEIMKYLNSKKDKLQNIQIFGLSSWNNPDILSKADFSGSIIADINRKNYDVFEKHFFDTYGYRPTNQAALVYDAVSLSFNLARSDNSGNIYVANDAIENNAGFYGVTGHFRFKPSGLAQRKYDIKKIEENGSVITLIESDGAFSSSKVK